MSNSIRYKSSDIIKGHVLQNMPNVKQMIEKEGLIIAPGSKDFEFIVLGEPSAKQSTRINFTDRKAFKAASITRAENNFQGQLIGQLPKKFTIIDKALSIDYTFAFPIVTGMKKSIRERIKAGDIVYRPKKPDTDNLQKMVNDAMEGIVFLNDNQIVAVSVKKIYAERPFTRIRIKVIED